MAVPSMEDEGTVQRFRKQASRWLTAAVVVTATTIVGDVSRTEADERSAPAVAPIQVEADRGPAVDGYRPVEPARVLDTRDPNDPLHGALGASTDLTLQIAGRGGVPSEGVGAVVLNVTAAAATERTFVTVYPTGAERPTASNLNVERGQARPNLVIAKVDDSGRVSLYNARGNVHLIVDVAGWFPTASRFEPLVPQRVLDTRSGVGVSRPAPISAGGEVDLRLDGIDGFDPDDAVAVVLNVTSVNPTESTFVTAYPNNEPRPLASNLNVTAGETAPNLVVVKLGAFQQVTLYNEAGDTDLLADILGWFPVGGLNPVSPTRVLDTRVGVGAPAGAIGSGETVELHVAGTGLVPESGVGAVVLNVTATAATATTFITVYPGGESLPLASNLNLQPGQTRPNLVIVQVGLDGRVELFNEAGSVHLIADIAGWFPLGGSAGDWNAIDTADGVAESPTETAMTISRRSSDELELTWRHPSCGAGRRVQLESVSRQGGPQVYVASAKIANNRCAVSDGIFFVMFDLIDPSYAVVCSWAPDVVSTRELCRALRHRSPAPSKSTSVLDPRAFEQAAATERTIRLAAGRQLVADMEELFDRVTLGRRLDLPGPIEAVGEMIEVSTKTLPHIIYAFQMLGYPAPTPEYQAYFDMLAYRALMVAWSMACLPLHALAPEIGVGPWLECQEFPNGELIRTAFLLADLALAAQASYP